MIFTNAKDFQKNCLKLLRSKEDVIITKYGKPVAKLVPFTSKEDLESLAAYFEIGDEVTKNLKDNRQELDSILAEVKKEIYG